LEGKIDKRVSKTKKAIKSALIRLISEKDPMQITVAELSMEAEIERKTFYSHYNGVYEVIWEMENELLSQLEEVIRNMETSEVLANPYVIFENIMLVINRDMDLYGYLLEFGNRTGLDQKLKSMVKLKLVKAISDEYNLQDDLIDLVAEYTISGMFAVYSLWFNSDRSSSIEDISKILSVTCSNGIKGLLEKQKSLKK